MGAKETHRNMVPPSKRKQALLTPRRRLRRLLELILIQHRPLPRIPNLDRTVQSRRDHPVPERGRIDRDGDDGGGVSLELDLGARDGRGPEGY